jgi:penicillin-binding protein 1B
MRVTVRMVLNKRLRFTRPNRRIILAASIPLTVACATFLFYYLKYARVVDQKLRSGLLENSSMIYAARRTVVSGGEAKIEELASYLRRCGYSESRGNALGWFQRRGDTIDIHPGPDGYVQGDAEIQVERGHIARLTSLSDGANLTQLSMEPEVITNYFDRSREMGGCQRAAEIAGRLHAHAAVGADFMARAATRLEPQDSGDFDYPAPEHTLTKQQIFEDYANAIYLGHLGSFSIHGFEKASRVYWARISIRSHSPTRPYWPE